MILNGINSGEISGHICRSKLRLIRRMVGSSAKLADPQNGGKLSEANLPK